MSKELKKKKKHWNPVVGKKLKNYVLFWLYDFVQILLVCGTILKEFMERLPMSALAAVAGKSLHILFYKYLDHVLVKIEQNRMVRTIQIFELFDQKWLTIFYKVLTPFWKTFLWLKQLFDAKLINSKTIIFKCSENYGRPSPTRNQVKCCIKHGRPNHS